MLRELLEGAALLTAIAGGTGLVALFGRDPRADEHDLADYHEPKPADEPATDRPGLHPSRRNWPLVDVDSRPAVRRSLRSGGGLPLPVQEPARPVVTPPLCRRLLVERAVPTLSDAAVRGIADEWLREIAAEEQVKAGITPRVVTDGGEHWPSVDGSCWADCPGCARDLVGVFPVVRAA